jgi:hypothetical protein
MSEAVLDSAALAGLLRSVRADLFDEFGTTDGFVNDVIAKIDAVVPIDPVKSK